MRAALVITAIAACGCAGGSSPAEEPDGEEFEPAELLHAAPMPDGDIGSLRVPKYLDGDGDGFGAGARRWVDSSAQGYTPGAGDCDDEDARVYPGAVEICGDGVRNGCDAAADACRYDGAADLGAVSVLVTTEAPTQPHFSAAAGLGDVDGDGLDDVLFGGHKHEYSTFDKEGAAYVYSGRTSRDDLRLDDADTIIVGVKERHYVGWFVERAGDVNGDGFADVLVGPGDSRSDVALFYGPLGASLTMDEADATLVTSPSAAYFAGVGDLNGDGFSDLVMSLTTPIEPDSTGISYISVGPVYGAVTTDRADVSWAATGGIAGLGIGLGRVGDVSGDGVDDLALAARRMFPDAHGSEGGLFVAHDIGSGTMTSDDADARVYGTMTWHYAATDFTGDGDFDGDGYGDLLISAITNPDLGQPEIFPERLVGGWIVLGPVAGDLSLDDAHATIVVRNGVEGSDGVSVASPGDMDGDGQDEAVFGFSEAGGVGAITIWYGPVASGTHVYDEADGVIWGGVGWGSPGEPGQLDAAGDFNGDGLGDLVVSSLGFPPAPSGFVILGGNF